VQLGDAFGEQETRVIFKFLVPGLADLGPKRIADVVVRYVALGEQVEAHEVTIPVAVNLVDAGTAEGEAPDTTVTDEVIVLQAAEARKRADDLADEGRYDEAKKVLDSAAEALEKAAPDSPRAAELRDDAARLRFTSERFATGSYDGIDKKRMHFESYSSHRSRPKPPPRKDDE
jgi:hypothetical protein